jgi:hypothetical protein
MVAPTCMTYNPAPLLFVFTIGKNSENDKVSKIIKIMWSSRLTPTDALKQTFEMTL